MNVFAYSVLAFSMGVFLVTVLAVIKRKDAISLRYLNFSIAVCGWGFIYPVWITGNLSESMTLFLAKAAYAFVVFIPSTWIHFVLDFTEEREPFKGFIFLNYLVSALFILSLPGHSMFTGLHSVGYLKYMPTPGVIHHFHIAHFFTVVPLGFTQLVRVYRAARGQRRVQIAFFSIGTCIGFVFGGALYIPFCKIPIPDYVPPFIIFYPIFTGISLVRFGLFDAEKIAAAFQRDKLAAIGTLAASINHEIKNPLYVMQGLGQSFLANVKEGLIEESELKTSALGLVERLTMQSTRAIEIMRKFAVFAKQEVRESPGAASISLKSAIDNVLPLVRHEFELNKIQIEVSLPPELPAIRFDPHHLEQVLFNLLLNAAQALKPQGGGKIRISAAREDDKIKLCVQDNGPGISKEDLKKIFEPFYTTKSEGTGLGLYITRQLVEANGGKIQLESEVGKGTKFMLVIGI